MSFIHCISFVCVCVCVCVFVCVCVSLQGLYLWVCKDAPQEDISKILGVPHFGAIPETVVNSCGATEGALLWRVNGAVNIVWGAGKWRP